MKKLYMMSLLLGSQLSYASDSGENENMNRIFSNTWISAGAVMMTGGMIMNLRGFEAVQKDPNSVSGQCAVPIGVVLTALGGMVAGVGIQQQTDLERRIARRIRNTLQNSAIEFTPLVQNDSQTRNGNDNNV